MDTYKPYIILPKGLLKKQHNREMSVDMTYPQIVQMKKAKADDKIR